ncbi:hypothetical protein M0802_001025 [Mischocyttarus mexicanus]|nr:hypothetical protein M0802_001025 [Mischocyttarus mexicanus]
MLELFGREAEPRLRLGSNGEAADRREDKFVPQLRRACRSKSCLGGSSSFPAHRYKTINRDASCVKPRTPPVRSSEQRENCLRVAGYLKCLDKLSSQRQWKNERVYAEQ